MSSSRAQEPPLECEIEDLIKYWKGTFTSWHDNGENVKNLLVCIDNIENIRNLVLDIIDQINNINLDLKKLIVTLKNIIIDIEGIIDNVFPCIDAKDDLIVLLERVIYLSPSEFLARVYLNFITNALKINYDIKAAILAYSMGDYYSFGYYTGEILELMIFRSLPTKEYNEFMKKMMANYLES